MRTLGLFCVPNLHYFAPRTLQQAENRPKCDGYQRAKAVIAIGF